MEEIKLFGLYTEVFEFPLGPQQKCLLDHWVDLSENTELKYKSVNLQNMDGIRY